MSPPSIIKPDTGPFASGSYLERDLESHYKTWQQDPSPINNSAMLKAVQPAIDKAIRTYVGEPNPVLQGHARRMALDAVRSYNPGRAGLRTHIMNHLHGLTRFARQQAEIVPIPERDVYLRRRIIEQENLLRDELNREPTMTELADRTGFSARYIQKLRHQQRELPAGMFEGNPDMFVPSIQGRGRQDLIVEMLHDDLTPTDQKILEWSFGMGGSPILQNAEIAKRLKLSPGSVSRRKQMMQARLDRMMEISPVGGDF